MNDIWTKIKVFYHKLNDTGYSELMLFQDIYGKFRVKYTDGEYSGKMAYSTAKDYSEMFGGEVIYYKECDLE